jgi:hypothetical protein
LDWDELEEQARRDDKTREYSDEEEGKHGKRKGEPSAAAGKKMRH